VGCEQLIAAAHYLRRLTAAIDFEPCRALVADCYAAGMGAPAEDPVRRLKLSRLQFPYARSESQVVGHAQGNVAFGFFLDLSLESPVPVPSLLSQLRPRLGVERFTQIFTDLLRQARARGLVKARLRLKAATHLSANLAIPSTVRWVAQTREQGLVTAEGLAASEVAVQRAPLDALRTATVELRDEQRRRARVTHLRALGVWGAQWQQRLRAAAAEDRPLATAEPATALSAALAVAHKGLNDREPKAQDTRLSRADTDGRAGQHGDSSEGSVLAVSRDADSELSCALAGLPATGEEGANATPLSTSAEQAHGNASASLSLDRSG